MSVNSSGKGFFDHHRGKIFFLLIVFLLASSFVKHADRDLRAKEVNVIIRQMGHRLLQQAGDSTSRVLPVTEIKRGTFQLTFEKELVFNNDSLMALAQHLLPKTAFPSGYIITVHDCQKEEIVYGFLVNNTAPDLLACRGRNQPPGCYTIELTFPDFYENAELKKADIEMLTQELKSADLAHAAPKDLPSSIFAYPSILLVGSGLLVIVGITFLVGRFRKNVAPVPVQQPNATVSQSPASEMSSIGKFLFDAKGQRLLLRDEVIGLTEKEYKILELLHKNFGELISRETLMQQIWINEGVITGRSLDMFVSKLRKKLSGDPELRITNVHGKGYRLEQV
jgi:Transcriptional regulatory protein, C terminal